MILVSGANGLVGANLVRALESGYPVPGGSRLRALVHQDPCALQGLDVELVQVESNNVAALQQVFMGAELVFHLAGAISRNGEISNQLVVGCTFQCWGYSVPVWFHSQPLGRPQAFWLASAVRN